MLLLSSKKPISPFFSIATGCLLLLFSAFPNISFSQQKPVHYFFTEADFRVKFYDALVRWTIDSNLSASLDNATGRYDFRSSFWPMELVGYKSDFVKQRLAYAFQEIDNCSVTFQRGLLEVVYAKWPNTFVPQVAHLLQQTTHPKIFAMCAEYLIQGGKMRYKHVIVRELRNTFRDSLQNPIIKMLAVHLSGEKPETLPPIKDLLSLQFAPGLTVLYSFQRPNRKYPGRVIVRKPDGTFVQDSSGKLFSVPQLALSVSNLPFYLTNGNTPQGIYRMSGFAVSNSRFIGPTQNIQLSMPFEIPVDSFIISKPPYMNSCWSIEKYKVLLPKSWKNHLPIYHSFYAGKAGRTAIIAHGTTIDPNYYKGTSYYPQTPSLGCLCTLESWSADGYRQRSDQQRLVDAVKKAGNGIGYLVVINLEDKANSVSQSGVEQLVKGLHSEP